MMMVTMMTMMDILTAITLWERESYKIRHVLNNQRIHMRCEISTPKGGEVEQSSKLWLSPPPFFYSAYSYVFYLLGRNVHLKKKMW